MACSRALTSDALSVRIRRRDSHVRRCRLEQEVERCQAEERECAVRELVVRALSRIAARHGECYRASGGADDTRHERPGPWTPPIERTIRALQQQDWGEGAALPLRRHRSQLEKDQDAARARAAAAAVSKEAQTGPAPEVCAAPLPGEACSRALAEVTLALVAMRDAPLVVCRCPALFVAEGSTAW